MSEMTGIAGSDVLAAAALVVILPLCALALSPFPWSRKRPGLSFACYWVLLLFSAGLLTSAVVNLTLIGLSRFWMTAGGTGAIGILVTFSRGPALWLERRERLRTLEVDAEPQPSPAVATAKLVTAPPGELAGSWLLVKPRRTRTESR